MTGVMMIMMITAKLTILPTFLDKYLRRFQLGLSLQRHKLDFVNGIKLKGI